MYWAPTKAETLTYQHQDNVAFPVMGNFGLLHPSSFAQMPMETYILEIANSQLAPTGSMSWYYPYSLDKSTKPVSAPWRIATMVHFHMSLS